jgi:hypothetical protein
MFMKERQQRPNRKMPLSAHKEVAVMLQDVLDGARYRQGVYIPVRSIISRLDDWVQCEYPSEVEMSSYVFHHLYFDDSTKSLLSPVSRKVISNTSRQDLHQKLMLVSEILRQHYHACGPLTLILKKIEKADESLMSWKTH